MTRAALLGAAAAAALAWAPVSRAGASGSRHHRDPGGVQAFLLSSSPDSVTDLRAHAGEISVVYPTYYECTSSGGGVAGTDMPAIDSLARSDAIPVVPRFNCQDGSVVHRLLTEPGPRARLLTKLTAIAGRAAYDGLCLDLENDSAADREALSSFVSELGQKLHRLHRRLAVAVDGVTHEGPGAPNSFYDDRALSEAADTVFVMAWGTHWEGSSPGAISTLSFVGGVVAFLRTLPDRSRFVVGAPMYGLDWAGSSGSGQPLSSQPTHPAVAYQYNRVVSLAHSVGAHPVREPLSGELSFSYSGNGGVSHQVFYMDSTAILDVLRIARDAGFQVGLWRLGSEDQALWSSPLVS
ncbi:MAG TPA: glycosyl hydrolase family 18 protein [Solirubrobacteraceae bacterium]|nr:glycosyl hydrolase family 18 protein [Solirubrobacteraceae bacterium]